MSRTDRSCDTPTMRRTDKAALGTAVAGRLRAARARLGLTLREAAERSGVELNSISRYERGAVPNLPALYALAAAYALAPFDLLPSPVELGPAG